MNRDADLLFILARLWFDRKGDGRFRILNRIVNDRVGLVAQRVAGLRLFQLHTSDDVAGVRFGNFIELFALSCVQRAQTFRDSARRVINRRVRADLATEDLEDVNASGEWISDGAEAVRRERFAV